ncbi:MAG TPA: nucleotidyltransferase family protein [Pyrinomonadaceae bacterium]|nr:nucleotidyltransferase family protein [Pyrinomonadaceae bacterium]
MRRELNKGSLIAEVLAGSWRQFPSPLEITAEQLEIATPSLLESGAAALGWKRVSNSNLRTSTAALQLEQAYRLHALQSAIHERDIQNILSIQERAGIEPVLVKGWAIARLYPEAGLRPYGDIDLCVSPKQFEAAKAALGNDANNTQVDLHQGFVKLDTRSWDELYARSQLLKIDRVEVRVLGLEDHLRALCYHFLREGAWRPLWLCDIAVAVESRPADFDWDLFKDGNSKRRDWFACAIALARHLLGADLDGVPEAIAEKRLPGWLIPSVLKAWEVRSMFHRHKTPMTNLWRRPSYSLKPKNLRTHWPNAIEGTIGVNGPFNEMPRLPFQLGNCAVRAIDYLRRLPRMLRDDAANYGRK